MMYLLVSEGRRNCRLYWTVPYTPNWDIRKRLHSSGCSGQAGQENGSSRLERVGVCLLESAVNINGDHITYLVMPEA